MIKLLLMFCTISFYNALFVLAYLLLLYFVQRKLKNKSKQKYNNAHVISFLHPFCNDCGGGEKVLWMIIKGMSMHSTNSDKKIKINILCGIKDDASLIKKNLRDRFEIDFNSNVGNKILDIELVRLKSAHLLKPKSFMTMFLQIVGQIIFALEIITSVHSDLYIDTTGLPFTYVVLKLLGRSNVAAYVHYPMISNAMVSDVREGVQGVHSRGFLSKFKVFKYVKVIYYYIIMLFYRFNGLFVELALCNSTWTYNHMKLIWPNVESTILYPPCSTQLFETNQSNMNRRNIIVSFAQFRPEKRHKMQVDIFRKLKAKMFTQNLKMLIIGSTRDAEDRKLFDELQDYINSLDLSKDIELCPNLPLNKVKERFEISKIGIHTMKDEHFGISIIEMMAAGLIVVAHKSAGPLNDIIGPALNPVGILADNEDDYVDQIQEALEKYQGLQLNITREAKLWVRKFSNEEFMIRFVEIATTHHLL